MTFRVQVLTTSRADFGIYASVLAAFEAHPDLHPELIVTGMHMSERHGVSLAAVKASPYQIAAQFPCLEDGDAPVDIAQSMARATSGMAAALDYKQPDILVTLGDRFEMLAAALAAVPFSVPLAHIHGGEETEGAIDNVFRHMLTKMSHLHFPATEISAHRIRLMGEDPDNIIISGAPALDSIIAIPPVSAEDILARFGLDIRKPFHLVTYHTVTLEPELSLSELRNMLAVLGNLDAQIVFSGTNADTGGLDVAKEIETFATSRENVLLVESFGAPAYYTVMRHAETMIGNSSSGIIEAASAGLPVVNIGARQDGRERSTNVVDTAGTLEGIEAALIKAMSLRNESFVNIYGQGDSGLRIAAGVADFLKSKPSPRKRFQKTLTP